MLKIFILFKFTNAVQMYLQETVVKILEFILKMLLYYQLARFQISYSVDWLEHVSFKWKEFLFVLKY
jgi:hypothetical protein